MSMTSKTGTQWVGTLKTTRMATDYYRLLEIHCSVLFLGVSLYNISFPMFSKFKSQITKFEI